MSRFFVSGTKQRADHERHHGDHDRVPEPIIDIAGLGDHGEGRRRHQAAEPAVADVVGQRHAGIADAGREQLDQCGGDRPVDHGDQDHQERQHQHQREGLSPEDVEEARHLHDLRIAGGRISRRRQRVADRLVEGGRRRFDRVAAQLRRIVGGELGIPALPTRITAALPGAPFSIE